jgi:hypothetical protein
MLRTVGSTLEYKWEGIAQKYRTTCSKVISLALSQESFRKSKLKTKLNAEAGAKDVSESIQALIKANFLSEIVINTYTFHSKVVKEYLTANLDNFV